MGLPPAFSAVKDFFQKFFKRNGVLFDPAKMTVGPAFSAVKFYFYFFVKFIFLLDKIFCDRNFSRDTTQNTKTYFLECA